MDPFNKLPAEIRIQINIQLRLRSKPSILSIIQASPAMLNQYIASKFHIIKKSLASDFDEEMLHDATRIIQFSSWSTTIVSSRVLGTSFRSWTAQELPNPFKGKDHGLIGEIDKPHSRLLLFIEDYLTKATAVFPPREYLCLPDLSSTQGHLMFKNKMVSPRFNAVHLMNQERRRLFRAFLRHELICKVSHRRSHLEPRLDWGLLQKYKGQAFRHSEREAIECVHEYLVSLYGAMCAQCGDSWLPDIPHGTLSSHDTGLLYPDNLYVDADHYACDIGSCVSSSLACFGFDLATILIRSATSGQHGRDGLKSWFRDPSTDGCSELEWRAGSLFPDPIFSGTKDMLRQEGSGMFRSLSLRFEDGNDLQQHIYRQRAWVFLDDARLYPSFSLAPHFPTSDEIVAQNTITMASEEWFMGPLHTRARHRSRKWHEKGPLSVDDNQYQDSELEAEYEDPLPPLFVRSEQTRSGQLARFWR
ncbi:hypothetical protein AK830_g10645 [Neonectria ditissima]|uniref:Uncharacterized protein n=1 Tax=Neonectria ditissima TaxID=78410 RepID=A0A0P7AT22_9HYPO|nr:hypothetical protein AK830_g10645 [Neonectria ditissima]